MVFMYICDLMMRCRKFDDKRNILDLRSIRHDNEVIVECVISTLLAYNINDTQHIISIQKWK